MNFGQIWATYNKGKWGKTVTEIGPFEKTLFSKNASVAQAHGALDLQSRGREFESRVGRVQGVNIGIDKFTP